MSDVTHDDIEDGRQIMKITSIQAVQMRGTRLYQASYGSCPLIILKDAAKILHITLMHHHIYFL